MDYRVKRVVHLMKSYLHKGWPAARMAKFVNLSPSRLHQLFKDETGLPPAKYLNLLRMERARELLETSYLSVKEVMARVGLADESHFVRDFKRSFGLTPAKYRDRFQNGHADKRQQAERLRLDSAPIPTSIDSKPTNCFTNLPAKKRSAPLLLRRASYPRYLVEENSQLTRAQMKRDVFSLLYLRHLAFAQLTTAITDNLAQKRSTARPISYKPRKETLLCARLTEHGRRRLRLPHPPSSVTPPVPPCFAQRSAHD